MGTRRGLELMQEFTAEDTDLCDLAKELQDRGAEFERFYQQFWSPGFFSFDRSDFVYRMVSLPPGEPASEPTPEPTIEPGEEFGVEKFALAQRMLDAGVYFQARNHDSNKWLPVGGDVFGKMIRSTSPRILELCNLRVYRRVPDADAAPSPDAVASPASPLFEVGKRYATPLGDVFEVVSTTGTDEHEGVPQPIEARCVAVGGCNWSIGTLNQYTREGWFHGKNGVPGYNLLPVEVQAEADPVPPSTSSDVSATIDVPDNPTSDLDRRAAESSKDELIQLLLEHERQLLSAGFRLAGEALLSSGENPDLHRPLVLAVVEWSRVAGALVDRSGDGS